MRWSRGKRRGWCTDDIGALTLERLSRIHQAPSRRFVSRGAAPV